VSDVTVHVGAPQGARVVDSKGATRLVTGPSTGLTRARPGGSVTMGQTSVRHNIRQVRSVSGSRVLRHPRAGAEREAASNPPPRPLEANQHCVARQRRCERLRAWCLVAGPSISRSAPRRPPCQPSASRGCTPRRLAKRTNPCANGGKGGPARLATTIVPDQQRPSFNHPQRSLAADAEYGVPNLRLRINPCLHDTWLSLAKRTPGRRGVSQERWRVRKLAGRSGNWTLAPGLRGARVVR